MFADVIVDINNVEVDKIFEYSFSDCDIKIGSRVAVPFGQKIIEGVVIGVKEVSKFDPEKIFRGPAGGGSGSGFGCSR